MCIDQHYKKNIKKMALSNQNCRTLQKLDLDQLLEERIIYNCGGSALKNELKR
jgi:hypothetical protein